MLYNIVYLHPTVGRIKVKLFIRCHLLYFFLKLLEDNHDDTALHWTKPDPFTWNLKLNTFENIINSKSGASAESVDQNGRSFINGNSNKIPHETEQCCKERSSDCLLTFENPNECWTFWIFVLNEVQGIFGQQKVFIAFISCVHVVP